MKVKAAIFVFFLLSAAGAAEDQWLFAASDDIQDSLREEPAGQEPAPGLDDEHTPFGYMSLKIYPGFKRIRLDKENTIGFSDNILVPAGSHWVEIISLQGYADTSFKVNVASGESFSMVVQLLDKVTGQPAPAVEEKSGAGSGSLFWTTLKVSVVAAGVVAGYLAYREENLAVEAKKVYDRNGAVNDPVEFDQSFQQVEKHVGLRKAFSVTSIGLLGAGLILWIVK